jgi:hypothetical protein
VDKPRQLTEEEKNIRLERRIVDGAIVALMIFWFFLFAFIVAY